jgi:hypothetical protein
LNDFINENKDKKINVDNVGEIVQP